MPKRILQGTVVSDKGDKTVVVSVERRFTDPVMKKTVRKSKRYHAHDASNEVKVGDITIPNWRDVPTNSRVAYGTIPSPGTVIASPLAYDHAPDQKRFAVLVCHIELIQLLLLGNKHIRAQYKKATDWQGEWLSP